MVDGQAGGVHLTLISAAFKQSTNEMVPVGRLQRSFRLSIPVICLLNMVLLVSAEAFVPLIRNDASPLQGRTAKPSSEGEYNEHSVEVSYEGRSCEIRVRPYETLLAAMERTGAADRLSLPSLPADCRRGNCLTCSGRHAKGSTEASLHRGDDGLSPHMSKAVKKAGYVLTCSSFVVGDGVKVQLGEHNHAWNAMYRLRISDEAAVHVGREAMARVIRRSAEANVSKWKRETEQVLKQTD